jgi:hypothetical protein
MAEEAEEAEGDHSRATSRGGLGRSVDNRVRVHTERIGLTVTAAT